MSADLKEKLLCAAEEILGLPQDEMQENMDMDLFENGLIDSLGCVSLMNYMEEQLGKKIDISVMVPEDFMSLNSMALAISRMLNL